MKTYNIHNHNIPKHWLFSISLKILEYDLERQLIPCIYKKCTNHQTLKQVDQFHKMAELEGPKL